MVFQPLNDIDYWRTRLGLLPVPLFNDHQVEPSFVLLNGNRGNFCLDFQSVDQNIDPRAYAWSANVAHYVTLSGNYIEVQRWDQQKSSIERYTQSSIYNNLEKFHEYLEKNSPKQEISIISHSLSVFRRLRATLGKDFSGIQSLQAYLYLLASVADKVEKGLLHIDAWKLNKDTNTIIGTIRTGDWTELVNHFTGGRPIEGLTPNINLLLRHASGQLFQEAHFEALFVPQNQLNFEGFLPSPVRLTKESGGIGIYFTPAALARTLVEETIARLNLSADTIFIFDPACGSGEFLRESLRQLKLNKYQGKTRILGWDISHTVCEMANFLLAWELRDVNSNVEVEIVNVDSLAPNVVWPENVDAILMNPPFVAWQDLSNNQKERLIYILGDYGIQRPNLAYAFLLKSSTSLKDNGILGTVLPASLLNATSASKLREYLGHQLAPKLIARLGSHSIFFNATIDPALYLAQKDTSSEEPTIAFWADYRQNSSSAGLRTLRKIRNNKTGSNFPVNEDGFSIYKETSIGHDEKDWAPRPYNSWVALRSINNLPKIKDIYEIYQGIRTGANPAFLLESHEWKELPKQESQYFRPAVVNKSIKYGFLKSDTFVFYPYGDCTIASEIELREKLPYYYANYLLPNKNRLLSRPRVKIVKWWELSEHRAWQEKPESKIVSTYFGNAGSFAWDDEGNYAVVQGFGWILKKAIRNKTHLKRISLAYLAIINSPFFSELLSAVSNNVSGGQWDLSKRFISNISIPDFFAEYPISTNTQKLSTLGDNIFLGLTVDEEILTYLVKKAYVLE